MATRNGEPAPDSLRVDGKGNLDVARHSTAGGNRSRFRPVDVAASALLLAARQRRPPTPFGAGEGVAMMGAARCLAGAASGSIRGISQRSLRPASIEVGPSSLGRRHDVRRHRRVEAVGRPSNSASGFGRPSANTRSRLPGPRSSISTRIGVPWQRPLAASAPTAARLLSSTVSIATCVEAGGAQVAFDPRGVVIAERDCARRTAAGRRESSCDGIVPATRGRDDCGRRRPRWRADSGRRRAARGAPRHGPTLSGKNITPNWQTTRSKLPSSNGSSSASACWKRTLGRGDAPRGHVEHRRIEVGRDDLGFGQRLGERLGDARRCRPRFRGCARAPAPRAPREQRPA